MFRSHGESPSATRAPRGMRGRKVGALAVGLAVALLGACSPGSGSAEGQSRVPAEASATPEAAAPTQAAPSSEASKTREAFPAAVQEALHRASASTRCRLASAEDRMNTSGQGGGEGTSTGSGEVALQFTFKNGESPRNDQVLEAAGTVKKGGALSAFGTGTRNGQTLKGTSVNLQGGVPAPVPLDAGIKSTNESFYPNGDWSEGSRVSIVYTGMAGVERDGGATSDSYAVMASTSAECAGSLVYKGGKWSLVDTPHGMQMDPVFLECGAAGQPLLACDPEKALQYP